MPAATSPDIPPPPATPAIDMLTFPVTVIQPAVASVDLLRELAELLQPALVHPRSEDIAARRSLVAIADAMRSTRDVGARIDQLGDQDLQTLAALAAAGATALGNLAVEALAELLGRAHGLAAGAIASTVLVGLDGKPLAPARAQREGEVWLHPDVPDPTGGPYDVPTCRRCGCTDAQACVLLDKDQKTVIASCAWRELNPETNAGVCTACAE
jgi:hypothetical protein